MTIVTKPKDKAKPTENYHIVISSKSYKSLATNLFSFILLINAQTHMHKRDMYAIRISTYTMQIIDI